MAAFVLHSHGYSNVRLIGDDLEGLRTNGFTVVGEAKEVAPILKTIH